MTPLKQQISLIPFSIEHTGIALTSDGVLKIGEIRHSVSVEVFNINFCCFIPFLLRDAMQARP